MTRQAFFATIGAAVVGAQEQDSVMPLPSYPLPSPKRSLKLGRIEVRLTTDLRADVEAFMRQREQFLEDLGKEMERQQIKL